MEDILRMPVYCPEFEVLDSEGRVDGRAIVWDCFDSLVRAYEEFCLECEKWRMVPAPVFVYFGEPGDVVEWQERPDYVVDGVCGQIVITK